MTSARPRTSSDGDSRRDDRRLARHDHGAREPRARPRRHRGEGDATLTVAVTGLTEDGRSDDGTLRVMRRALPDLLVESKAGHWRPVERKDGAFALAGLPTGPVDVLVYVTSAAGDMQVVREQVSVAGPTSVTVDVPAARELISTFGPTNGKALWGIALALPRGPYRDRWRPSPKLVAAAPWWSVTWSTPSAAAPRSASPPASARWARPRWSARSRAARTTGPRRQTSRSDLTAPRCTAAEL